MSDENKSLGDQAEEAFENAKEKASEFADEAKDAASDFADGAKKTADEFKEGVKETFGGNNPDAGKNVAIIAHLTIVGWIVALIMNNSNKTELGSFYVRQVLGLAIFLIILYLVPLVGWILNIGVFILWLISLINAFGGKTKPIPLLGESFQNWFKGL